MEGIKKGSVALISARGFEAAPHDHSRGKRKVRTYAFGEVRSIFAAAQLCGIETPARGVGCQFRPYFGLSVGGSEGFRAYTAETPPM